MEMMVVNMNALPLASSGKTSPGTGKSDVSTNPFGSLLQSVSASSGKDDKDSKQTTDPLLTLMMALSGGLTPAMLTQVNTANLKADNASETGPVLQLNLGGQNLSLALSSLNLTNGQVAELLQKFGVSQALLTQLLEKPQGQPAGLLVAHPELLSDLTQSLNQTLNQALNQATEQSVNTLPAVVQDPQVADLMQSVLAALTVPVVAKDQTQSDSPVAVTVGKQPSAFGKLQATFSVHAMQMTTNPAQNDVTNKTDAKTVATPQAVVQATTPLPTTTLAVAGTMQNGNDDQKQQQQPFANPQPITGTMSNLPLNLPLQLQNIPSNVPTSAPVVMVQANNFQNEFQDLLVKRAALIESPGRQEFRIVLQPQGLGEIEVRVQAVNNQISLHFTADSAQAKGLLDSGLAGLKNQLQEQGIRFDRIEVASSYSSGGFSSGLQQERGSSQNFQGQAGGQSQKRDVTEPFTIDSIQETAAGQAAETQTLDGIDVIA